MGELGALLRGKEAELSRLHSQLAASPDGASDLPLAALDGTGEVTAAVRSWVCYITLSECSQVKWSVLACATIWTSSCQLFLQSQDDLHMHGGQQHVHLEHLARTFQAGARAPVNELLI